ncbi:hypothetical protein H1R17_06870 [Flavobacterium sp. xlx-214]|uniref:hypothetical protein n=1 Tax=unclassified Flavobacterium TaxID=196869 RepID=UPI0013D1D080|nr:hypothetical protein [Flavobacterium sp. xlx-214]MBA5793861.1 hypothetical protein [Flavobacterium sp. xlx-221]QMI82277.1 hypothetical protein H1R17_06870 [Flavobacterium sp. xlx-214]
MKKLVIIFSFYMLLKPFVPILEYVVNYDYIVNELCVNRDKPELECNGKCHLAKQMTKASDTDDANDGKPVFSVESAFAFFHEPLLFSFEPVSGVSLKQKINDTYQSTYSYLGMYGVFHPPVV